MNNENKIKKPRKKEKNMPYMPEAAADMTYKMLSLLRMRIILIVINSIYVYLSYYEQRLSVCNSLRDLRDKEIEHLELPFKLTLKETNPALYEYVEARLKAEHISAANISAANISAANISAADYFQSLPKIHVGIIPDGNRRWCKQNNKSRQDYADMIQYVIKKVYNEYRDKIEDQALAPEQQALPYESFRLVDEISIYVLSKDNLLKRTDETMMLIEKTMDIICTLMRIESNKHLIKFDVYGDVSLLPTAIQAQIADCVRLSQGTFPIHLAIGYDPIEDSEIYLEEGLDSRRQMDLVIRSGGQIRSSGFFPLQTLYSEWVYFDDLWPDMNQEKFNKALLEYLGRQRNFGK
jgi:undecaprenyl diphosphate synthase